MIDNLSGGMGDLTPDIVGGQQGYLKMAGETIAHENHELDRIIDSWSKRKDGLVDLIPNNEFRDEAEAVSKERPDPLQQKTEALRVARWMIMMHEPSLKVEQYLQKAIEDGVVDCTDASSVLAERPLLGELYFDRNIAAKCVDLRKASENQAARHALYVVMAPGCEVCAAHYDGLCPETGRKLIDEIPTSNAHLNEASKHMMERGRIFSSVIRNWDDLKKAMSLEKHEQKIRVYPHASSAGVRQAPLPESEKAKALREAADILRENNEEINRITHVREVLPIARFVYEHFLDRTDPPIIRKELAKGFPDKKLIEAGLSYLKGHFDPLLLMAGRTAFPAFYDSCAACRDVLHKRDIRIANICN